MLSQGLSVGRAAWHGVSLVKLIVMVWDGALRTWDHSLAMPVGRLGWYACLSALSPASMYLYRVC
jgi:hypothetical protein